MPESNSKRSESGILQRQVTRLADDQFRQLADALPSIVWTCGADGAVDFFNRKWYEFTGQSPEEALGWGWLNAVHLDDRERVVAACHDYVHEPQPHEMQQRYRDADGTYRWFLVRARPMCDEQGNVEHWFGISTDIDEQYQAVYESRRRLELIHDASQIIIYDSNLVTGEILRNRHYVSQFGECIGDPDQWWSDRLHVDDRNRVTSSLKDAICSSAGQWHEAYRFRLADGQYASIQDRAHIVRNDTGTATRLLGSMLDVTEIQRVKQQLIQSERLAAIGQMLSAIAHESRGALQRITAAVDVLGFAISPDSEARADLNRVACAKDDLKRLFEDLRTYAAPINLNRTETSLSNVWHKAWASLEPMWTGRDTELLDEVGDSDLRCRIDPFRIEQVFRNLMENSLMACSDPARMTISHCESEVNGQPAIRITYRDDGPGLSHEAARQVFDAFFTTNETGTGLGMAIAQRIIEAHNGTIESGKASESGATFVITLPKEAEQGTRP